MKRPSTRIERWAEQLAMLAVAGLLALAVATSLDVLMRYVFAKPIRGFVDISSLAGAVLLAACMPYLLVIRGNMAVDALGRRIGGRARTWLDRFAGAVTAIFFAVMAWQYVLFSLDLRETGQAIPLLRWPVWYWWAAVATLIVLAAIAGLATLARETDADR